MGPMLSYAGVQPHVRPDSGWDPTQTALLGQSQHCFSCFYLASLGGVGGERTTSCFGSCTPLVLPPPLLTPFYFCCSQMGWSLRGVP